MTGEARRLMLDFAERTGLSSNAPADRYLWTDAFAVCNLLALGETDLALRLVDQVHELLGRHRADDPRAGWISGLDDAEAQEHPTIGGLRIGKELPERGADEPIDERLEWDRDGQYFHYLTRWMHALDQEARSTGDARYNRWARELAEAAHGAFAHDGRMHWKMSIDLSRPLVTSMGHHDPLDGYVTALQVGATTVAAGFVAMIPAQLATSDPLGIGGLLADAWRLEQLRRAGPTDDRSVELRDRILDAALASLEDYADIGEMDAPAEWRLAFRELGLAIGLAAVPLIGGPAARLAPFAGLRAEIESTWRRPEHRNVRSWTDHRNINEVMLATCLLPDGYLTLASA